MTATVYAHVRLRLQRQAIDLLSHALRDLPEATSGPDDSDDPPPASLRTIGAIGAIRQMAKMPTGAIHIIVEGLQRAKADVVTKQNASLRATVRPLPEVATRTIEVDAHLRRLHELIDRALSLSSSLSQELRGLVAGIDDPLRLVYLLASLLGALVSIATIVLVGGVLRAAFETGPLVVNTGDSTWAAVSSDAVVASFVAIVVGCLVGGWAAGRASRFDGIANGLL